MHSHTIELVLKHRLVAIIRLDDLSQAVEISKALLKGGIVVQEYTLTNPEALNAIGRVRGELEEFRNGQAAIGIGSIRSVIEARQAIEAGADFIVTPTLQLDVIELCRTNNIPVMPGAYTPSEIAQAWEAGACLVKVFPARQLGPNYIKDVLAPMPYLKLMPTGGIDLTNMNPYFHSGAAALGIGGQLINPSLVDRRDWQAVTEIAQKYASAARGSELR